MFLWVWTGVNFVVRCRLRRIVRVNHHRFCWVPVLELGLVGADHWSRWLLNSKFVFVCHLLFFWCFVITAVNGLLGGDLVQFVIIWLSFEQKSFVDDNKTFAGTKLRNLRRAILTLFSCSSDAETPMTAGAGLFRRRWNLLDITDAD